MSEVRCPVSQGRPLPVAEPETGLTVLKELARRRSFLAAMEVMQAEVGDAFQITLPSFEPAVFSGPTFNRCVLVSQRHEFLWRPEQDPVTRLLRHGLLVEDGEAHDALRALMEPATTRPAVNEHVGDMVRYTDRILDQWQDGSTVDMLVEMRHIALLILMGTLFGTDFAPEMDRLWEPILRSIKYISPGLWILWPNIPRPGYGRPLRQLDEYLYSLIQERRVQGAGSGDLLDDLIGGGLSDDLIRDQMLTMLIAGHDTSTALLSWTLYLLGSHPEIMARTRDEVDEVLVEQAPTVEDVNQLRYMDQVTKETLRLYPPIHVGNRMVPKELRVEGYTIPANTRVMYSIYLTHRDGKHWPDPLSFDPERFDRSLRHGRPALAYVPFGGGPRNCIGATFAQVESKVVLARIMQRFDLELVGKKIRPHMGATLEPRPGVTMRVRQRGANHG
ncbi:MAG: cytochrome P450 [Chloroflexota bacterium]|nr:MAG: cytochrome P450 [Chloroflexota bacterium]